MVVSSWDLFSNCLYKSLEWKLFSFRIVLHLHSLICHSDLATKIEDWRPYKTFPIYSLILLFKVEFTRILVALKVYSTRWSRVYFYIQRACLYHAKKVFIIIIHLKHIYFHKEILWLLKNRVWKDGFIKAEYSHPLYTLNKSNLALIIAIRATHKL